MGITNLASDLRCPCVSPRVARTIGDSAPVFSTARARMKRAATVIGAGLEKPDRASAGVTIPTTSTMTMPADIARAGDALSVISTARIPSTTARTSQASQAMRASYSVGLPM